MIEHNKENTKLKLGIIGFGNGGRLFNGRIATSTGLFEVVKILTSNPEKADKAREDYPEATVVSDYSQVLDDPEIDIINISTPNHLHKELAEKALQAGKHVVVEKPLTATIEQADALISLAREKNKILTVNHNRRWDSDFRTVKKVIEEKGLGRIVEYEAHFDRFRNEVSHGWKEKEELAGGGILYDLGSHLIDQALVLFGRPVEIFANLRIQRENAHVEDNFELLMFYPGLKVSLKAGMLVKEKGPTYSVFGTKGTFLKYGIDIQEEDLKAGKKPEKEAVWGKEPKEYWGKLNILEEQTYMESELGDYRKFYINVYNAISGREDLLVKPEQARDVINAIRLAQKSHAEKRIVLWKE